MISGAMSNQNASAGNSLPKAILILGAAKSGTTALFYAVRNALATGHGLATTGLFEPRRAGEVVEYLSSTPDQVPVVKVLLGPLLRDGGKFVEKFDKRIVIYRDPRDNVVSRVCFMLKKLISPREEKKIEQVLQLFREKEQSPDSISIVSMIRQMAVITDRPNLLESVRSNSLLPAKMKRENENVYFMMPYDDLVSGQFEPLNQYLGFTVSGDFEVAEQHSFVVRSKSSGAWKDWFLEEDVQFFARDVADDFRILGFDPDVVPNVRRSIDPKTSSEYVAAQFQHVQDKRRRAKETKQVRSSSGAEEQKKPVSPDAEKRRLRRLRRGAGTSETPKVIPDAPAAVDGKVPSPATKEPGVRKRRRDRQVEIAGGAGKRGVMAAVATDAKARPSSSAEEKSARRRLRRKEQAAATKGARQPIAKAAPMRADAQQRDSRMERRKRRAPRMGI